MAMVFQWLLAAVLAALVAIGSSQDLVEKCNRCLSRDPMRNDIDNPNTWCGLTGLCTSYNFDGFNTCGEWSKDYWTTSRDNKCFDMRDKPSVPSCHDVILRMAKHRNFYSAVTNFKNWLQYVKEGLDSVWTVVGGDKQRFAHASVCQNTMMLVGTVAVGPHSPQDAAEFNDTANGQTLEDSLLKAHRMGGSAAVYELAVPPGTGILSAGHGWSIILDEHGGGHIYMGFQGSYELKDFLQKVNHQTGVKMESHLSPIEMQAYLEDLDILVAAVKKGDAAPHCPQQPKKQGVLYWGDNLDILYEKVFGIKKCSRFKQEHRCSPRRYYRLTAPGQFFIKWMRYPMDSPQSCWNNYRDFILPMLGPHFDDPGWTSEERTHRLKYKHDVIFHNAAWREVKLSWSDETIRFKRPPKKGTTGFLKGTKKTLSLPAYSFELDGEWCFQLVKKNAERNHKNSVWKVCDPRRAARDHPDGEGEDNEAVVNEYDWLRDEMIAYYGYSESARVLRPKLDAVLRNRRGDS